MDKLVEELDRTVEAQCFLSALTLAVTIPGVCSKVEYPEILGESRRYCKWCREYISNSILTPEEFYALRCSVLHNGNDELKEQIVLQEIGESKDYYINIPYVRRMKYKGDAENEKRFCAAVVIQSIKQGYFKFKEKHPDFKYALVKDKL